MSFEREISGWDGKSVADITHTYSGYCHNDDFINQLITACKNSRMQKGASWLIKHYLECEQEISCQETMQIFTLLSQLEFWESKLHILQCFQYLKITESDKVKVEEFLRNNLVDNNKFVRAWAYNGFYQLSIQHPVYLVETKQFFAMAMKDEAPSVKARIRNILKQGF